MFRYILKRLLSVIPTLFVLITLAFFLMRLAPGGPFDEEKPVPRVIQERLEAAYGLDQPLHVQYVRYVGNLLKGDFGPSYQYKDRTVTELIRAGFPVSLRLGAIALLLACWIGITAGAIAALRQNSPLDHSVMTVAMVGITIPNFVVAPLLILVFAG